MAQLSIVELEQRLTVKGVAIPVGITEKHELVDLLMRAFATNSSGPVPQKIRTKSATKDSKREVFEKMVVVKTKPARKIA